MNTENIRNTDSAQKEQKKRETHEKLLRLLSGERDEQRKAITSLEQLTVVSAGAGTGKTHTLARRFAWLLAQDPDCRVEQILTLTFTHLAANEMRERIKKTLIEWRDLEPVLLRCLDDAIERIDEANISTIHSFALRAIRESGLDLDIDPGSSLIGDAVEREFWEDYRLNLRTSDPARMSRGLPDGWRARVNGHISSADYIAFLNYFGAETLAAIAEESGNVFGSMSELPEDFLAKAPEREETARRRIIRLLSGGWREASNIWHERVFPAISGEPGGGVFAGKLRELRGRWSAPPSGTEDAARFVSDLLCGPLARVPGNSGMKDIIEDALGEKLTDWKKRHQGPALISETLFSEPPYGDSEARARKMLLESAAFGWESWNAARRGAGGLTFSDLVRYATRVFASGAYAGRFRHVMVDEFQDTDGLQNEMIKALSSGGNCTVFLVGDIKQSIYRFRHAEPKLFASYMEMPDALNIPLSRSYRMSGAMMGAINAVFRHIWEDGVIQRDSLDVPALSYEPLLAPADAMWWERRSSKTAPPAPSPLELILYGERKEGASEPSNGEEAAQARKPALGEKRRALAAALARRLNDMTCGKEEIWDKEAMNFRPLRWGDIAILVPGRAFYGVLEEALEEARIPAVFESGREYFKRGEVRDMINLLRALDDPDDDFAFAGWAESPLSGMPPAASLDLAAEAKSHSSLWRKFSERFPDDASRFARLRRRARLSGPSSALRSLLEDTSWLSAYKPDHRRRLMANVLRGVEIAMDYESSFGTNLSACADYLGRAMRGGFAAEEPESAEEGDFVQVKTVHASKGQEFPVVALMGMESAIRSKSASRAAVSRHLGVVAKTLPPITGAQESPEESVTAKWHNILEEAEEGEEKERLLYVAMTRAKDRLICCGAASECESSRESWLSWLLMANERAGRPFPISFASDAKPEDKKRHKIQVRAEQASSSVGPCMADLPPAALASLSATAYSIFMWCPAAYRMKYRQGRELKWELPDGDGYGGADLGSLAHWTLSRWDMTPEGLDRLLPSGELQEGIGERIKRSLPAFLRPVFASDRDRDALRSWLLAFAATDECSSLKELAERGALRRELAFSVPFAGASLAGSIDLYWEDGAGMHVRDWKITQAELAPDELYREQVNFYSLVCRIASSPPHAGQPAPIDAGLIYLRPGSENGICEVWDARESDAVSQNVRNVIEAAASGSFPHARERCCRCPFRHACIPLANAS